MSEIIVLSKDELAEIIRQSMRLGVIEVLEKLKTKPTSEIMTRAEVANYLRCHESKIDRLMKKDLPFFMFGDTPRFRKSIIDEWLEK